MADRISATPNPVAQGANLQVCYDFTGLDATEAILALDWTPYWVEGASELTVTAAENCGTVAIPHDAVGLVIIDNSPGESNPKVVVITVSG